jgi:PAS domain S-box-containing protein
MPERDDIYRTLFDATPVPAWAFDPDTLRILAVNEATVRHYGWSRAELLGMTVADLKVPEERHRLPSSLARKPSGGHVGVRRHIKKDGTVVHMDIVSRPVTIDGRRARLAIGTDVSERARVDEQLRIAQKMEAVGQLAGGVAHDFNNMLAVILADAEFALGALEEGHPAAADVEEIATVARRAADLVRKLLTISRRQPRQPRAMDLHDVLGDIESMVTRLLPEGTALSVVRGGRGATIEADACQIEQVVLNLVLNARDALDGEGQITVGTGVVDLDASEGTRLGLHAGRHVVLTVADTGCGMDAATRQRIFEPFFTTKPTGKGTGLGLSTVFGIVQQSGGGIVVESEPGKGSTFRLYFPRIDAVRSRPTSRSTGHLRAVRV